MAGTGKRPMNPRERRKFLRSIVLGVGLIIVIIRKR